MLIWYSDRLRAGQPGFDSWQREVIFSTPQHPDWLWDSPNLISNGYQGGGIFLGDKAAEASS
jgi:hypothetical protein